MVSVRQPKDTLNFQLSSKHDFRSYLSWGGAVALGQLPRFDRVALGDVSSRTMGTTLFYMWPWSRSQLLERHEFYVEQARARLLAPFTDEAIESEADREAETWLEIGARRFDPDRDDPAEAQQAAYEKGAWRYELLTELRNNMRLSVVAGFFHSWEKNLRGWLVEETEHWLRSEHTREALWKKKVADLFELLSCFGGAFADDSYFRDLNACHLVVNVYKHGDGPSLQSLVKDHPEFLRHPQNGSASFTGIRLPANHEHLTVADEDVDRFADAIARFWSDVPENVTYSISTAWPKWFEKAVEKDRNDR